MPSDAAKKRQAQKREKKQASSRAAQKKVNAATTDPSSLPSASGDGSSRSNGGCTSEVTITNGIAGLKLSPRSCTGECTV